MIQLHHLGNVGRMLAPAHFYARHVGSRLYLSYLGHHKANKDWHASDHSIDMQ